MNTFQLIGTIIGAPDCRDTPNGVFICKLTLKTDEQAKGRTYQNLFRLTGFNEMAIKMKDVLPDHKVFASGSMRNSFHEKNGVKVQSIDFIVETFYRVAE